jgi:uncharacterized coiled-coil DUF342 family protein
VGSLNTREVAAKRRIFNRELRESRKERRTCRKEYNETAKRGAEYYRIMKGQNDRVGLSRKPAAEFFTEGNEENEGGWPKEEFFNRELRELHESRKERTTCRKEHKPSFAPRAMEDGRTRSIAGKPESRKRNHEST